MRGELQMNENGFPDNKTILKRVGIAIVFIAVVVALVCAKEHLSIVIWFLAAALSILLIILFIRLCIDVHTIAKHIDKYNSDDK